MQSFTIEVKVISSRISEGGSRRGRNPSKAKMLNIDTSNESGPRVKYTTFSLPVSKKLILIYRIATVFEINQINCGKEMTEAFAKPYYNCSN